MQIPINIKARKGDMNVEMAMGEFNLHANKDIKLTSDLNGHNCKCAGYTRMTVQLIDLNGPEAQPYKIKQLTILL